MPPVLHGICQEQPPWPMVIFYIRQNCGKDCCYCGAFNHGALLFKMVNKCKSNVEGGWVEITMVLMKKKMNSK